jgi:uncharacterized protein
MQQFNPNPSAWGGTVARTQVEVDQGLRAFMLGVYNNMVLGLAISALVALGVNKLAVASAFAAVMGASLSTLLIRYTGASVVQVFFITAASFGALSLYGYTTSRSLSAMGSFLMMGVIGLIIASLVNIFLASSALQFAISALGVLIFAGLTAYDTQKLKEMYIYGDYDGEAAAKASIFGALTLYLDFINMFQFLLALFGNRNN